MAQWDLQHEKGVRKTKLIMSVYSVAKFIFQIFIIVSFIIRTKRVMWKKFIERQSEFIPKNSPILIQNVPQSRSVVTVPRFSSRYISSPYLSCKVSTIQYIYIFLLFSPQWQNQWQQEYTTTTLQYTSQSMVVLTQITLLL